MVVTAPPIPRWRAAQYLEAAQDVRQRRRSQTGGILTTQPPPRSFGRSLACVHSELVIAGRQLIDAIRTGAIPLVTTLPWYGSPWARRFLHPKPAKGVPQRNCCAAA